MTTVITGGGVAGMKVLAVKLREAEPAVRLGMQRRFRQIADPAVKRAQRSIREMPVTGKGKPRAGEPLRLLVAGTVSASVGVSKTKVRLDVVSIGTRMPEGMERLPADLNRAGWGHPVFARPGVHVEWVRQHGKKGWFEGGIGPAARDAQGALAATIDEVAAKFR